MLSTDLVAQIFITQDELRLNSNPIYLRDHTDTLHGLAWYGDAKTFATFSPDGPVLYGFGGGILGTAGSGKKGVLFWNQGGNVGIGIDNPFSTLDVMGDIRMNQNDLYLIGGGDNNHGLGWYGGLKTFDTHQPDGPVLYGFNGGILGTTDGGQKATLFWNKFGEVGIGTAAPATKLHVVGDRIRLSSPGDENRYIDFRTDGNSLDISPVGADLYIDPGANDLLLATQTGKVGIGIEVPASKLHIAGGTIRIDNIPTGTGDAVLIDSNGDLVKAASPSNSMIQALQSKVDLLEAKLAKVERMLQQITSEALNENNTLPTYLQQNYPNPTNGSTTIPYFIPETTRQASLIVFDKEGLIVKQLVVQDKGQGQVDFDLSDFSSGTYTYSLIFDDRIVETKQMILAQE